MNDYTRPYTLDGITYHIDTPVGSAFITVNGKPEEVFINVGKAGSDIHALAEGLGRTLSIALQGGIEPEALIGQLKDIGGRGLSGWGKDSVRSLPDAVAQALARYIKIWEEENG